MKAILRYIFLFAISIFCFSAVYALDLPIKKVNGKQYYVYKVKKHETIFGISKALNIPVEEIKFHNPTTEHGLKKGMSLYFPFEQYANFKAEEEDVPADSEQQDTIVVENPSIAVVLPFGLGNQEQSRQNKLALDFYRGFLIAADSLCNRPGQIDINVFDCGNSIAELQTLLANNSIISNATVIVGPEESDMLAEIENHARTTGTFVMNVFNVRDSAYLTNPYVIQANIPQKEMYSLAIKAFMEMYEGYRPVILRNEKGRNEKDPFVEALTATLTTKGIEPIKISYDGTLLVADLESIEQSSDEKFVVVPSSGSLVEFNKFALVVKALRDRSQQISFEMPEEGNAKEIALFGYPDWTAFRGEALELLQKLNAKVYSRFFDNFLGFDSRIIADDFRFWFGRDMIESIPSQGLLGYDCANYLIRNIRVNEGRFNPEWKNRFQGIQSVFAFDRMSGQGYYNNALYIIEYLPEGRMNKRIIY